MSDVTTPKIELHGPAATHNYPCPVLHHDTTEKAVFYCDKGHFGPSWRAQAMGYRIVKADTWLKRVALKLAFGIKV